MDIPKLTADGRNWQTYGGWVLEAVAEDSLKGYLDGVRACQATDTVWQQQAAEAHYLIICSIPDSILMLCMHLEDPRDVFSYPKNRCG
ncbi:hypothetical protein PISMIDRAFT_115892 [Pisolithus microcarpus 441]|uniref:Unplaced genomic scaffold scaffold_225, whole genome shotgun sequence n=1 Tax=Pisolithus microcarpus 441 TaxID=765257 RepID=A0A0C9XRY5_9AGAM|nr:hypothetical protein PISMIDRAFT_115892 [Pisolithus microcarpus 441]